MNSLKIIGNYHGKALYYDLETKEFYALHPDLLDPDMEILNLDDNSDLAKKINEGKITNKAEVIALNLAYNANVEYQIKQEELFKNIEKLKKKSRIEEQRKLKNTYRNMIVGSLLLTLLAFNKVVASYGNLLKANVKDLVDDYRDNNENDSKHLNLFLKSIKDNDTISPSVKNLLELNFRYLLDINIYIPDHEVNRMCRRIKNFDFTSIDEENFDEVLSYLLFGEKNTLTNLIARQLSEVSSSKEPSMESLLFGELVSINNTELLESIFIHDENAFVKMLAAYYETDEESIRSLLNLIGAYSNTFLIEEKKNIEEEFHSSLRSLIINSKKGKQIGKDLEKYILSSQIFDGEYIFINNIFADTATVMVNDETYGPYNLYFNTDTGINTSIAVYYQKLVDLIKDKGNNLDYNDPDCRFLIYLINLAHMDSWDFDIDDLSSCATPDDLALKIINNNFMPYGGRVDVNTEFIYAYLTSGYLRLDDVLNQMRTPSNNAFSVSLFLELYRCLTIEEQEGNISYDDYHEKISVILDKIRENNPSIYEILMRSIEEENPLLDDLNLYPFTYEFNGEDIKKYIYNHEEK